MEIINNRTKLLGDDLKGEIKSGNRLRIAASCFSIYAYATLKQELDKIEELKFLFTEPAFMDKQVSDKIRKEKREFYIPKFGAESGLCGTEFEIKLRNQMTQKAIARECAEWIKNKVKIKTLQEQSFAQTMINVSEEDKCIHYAPVEGFTTADLGYEANGSKLVGIMKIDDTLQSRYFIDEFDRLWNSDQLQDITGAVIDYISSCYTENSPEFIYFIILYNVFKEFLQDLDEDNMPNEATGFKNSLIWSKLYNFQRDGVVGIVNKLEKYNGCILADSVGLGKTFTALAVMQYYSLRNKSILVLCPKRLEQNWTQYQGNKTTNIFYKDRIRFDVLFHTDLGRTSGKSGGTDLATVNWGNYDLVVIDESHNFRNNNSAHKHKETRYDFLMNRIMQDGVNTKVLMLSATPVNNRYNDLKNQLLLAYCGDMEEMSKSLELSKSAQVVFNNAQKAFNAWSKLPAGERHAKDLMEQLDIDFSIILDSVTIARSRKHIQKFYDTADIGKFPTRLPTQSHYPKLTNNSEIMSYKQIYADLLDTTMSVYAPLSKIFPSKREEYVDKYHVDFADEDSRANALGEGFERQLNREFGLKRLMTISLLKRLESSVYAFRLTLKSLMDINKDALAKIDAYLAGDRNVCIYKQVSSFEIEDLEDEEIYAEHKSSKKIIEIKLADMDVVSWKREMMGDMEILYSIYMEMERVTPDEDNKLQTLKALIRKKIANPFNSGNKKVLIFSAFADTADYLYANLAPWVLQEYGMRSAKIAGGNNNKTNVGGSPQTDRLLTLFSPLSKSKATIYPNEREDIDVLIGTDCISEGQNLQDCDICINYDIHWNPVRIVQRFGRIDRIGSQNEVIQLVNFWPDLSLDEYINLNKRVSARMTIVNATATADDNLLSTEENEEMDYRKEQLKRLQEGTLQDLEDVDGNISITDLGLNDFVMDLASYHKEHGEPRGVSKGLHAVVESDESRGIEKGVIFVLCNRNNSVNINKQNRLHPYYLVYVKENGEILHNHLEVKPILDVLRATCKGKSEPLADLCRSFNKETKDGAKMEQYNLLLQDAAMSIVEVKEQSDLASLFKSGSKVLYQQRIDGLDDFELISFVVIR